MNLYGFASGDPVNFSDPFGLCPVVGLAGGPIIGGATAAWCLAEVGTLALAATLLHSRRPTKAVKDEVDAENQERNGGKETCDYCGVEVTPEPGHPTSKEYDHKEAYAKGGPSDATNVCIACRTDNRKKGTQDADAYKKRLQKEGVLIPKSTSP